MTTALQKLPFLLACSPPCHAELCHVTILQSSSTTLAHTGGVSAMEVQGDLVATAGFNKRMGQVTADNMVKVFDCR